MRSLILLVLAMLSGGSMAAAAASPLLLQPMRLDLGQVAEGSQARGSLILRNTGPVPLSITGVQTSCGCTTGVLDQRLLPPGAFTLLHITIDTFAKRGRISKQVWVTDDQGHPATAVLRLTVRPNRHMRIAGRSIFDARCASCHAAPAAGQHEGAKIYAAVCAMCHGADARGAYAPSLRGWQDTAALARRIGDGAGNPTMPGFAKRRGGPLDAAQLRTLSHWLAALH